MEKSQLTTTLEPLIRAGITQKFPSVNISSDRATTWISKLLGILAQASDLDGAIFQLDEVIHYFKPSDFESNSIELGRDKDMLKHLYDSHSETKSTKIQAPEQTFGEATESEPCRKCRSKRTITILVQSRSLDEPTSEYSQCFQCNHRWRKC
jgi:DNA-directed RNA polymerase subunit M/transcription elongation factor TFIIS